MQEVHISLSSDLDYLEILPLSDWHLGDKNCDLDLINSYIDYIKSNKHVYCILNGDLMNNATKTSISDCYAEDISPMQQIANTVELLTPIKDKILAITSGNHEKRTYKKEGIDLTEIVARELKLYDRFSKGSIVIYVSVGNGCKHSHARKDKEVKQTYVIFCNHGSGGGRKEGAKAIRLADMASIIDADVYVHSHTHLPMIMKQDFYRVNRQTFTSKKVTKLFINTSSALNYGGYGEEYEYKPNSTDTPVFYLSGKERKASGRL